MDGNEEIGVPKPGPHLSGGGDMLGDVRITRLLTQLLDIAVDDCDVFEILDRLARGLAQLVPNSEVGLLLLDDQRHLNVVASTDESAALMELYQLQSREGPCVEAVRVGQRIAVDLDASRRRWPEFATQAVDRGFVSVVAIPLRLRGELVGCVNVFGRTTEVTRPRTVLMVQAVVDAAGSMLLARRRIDEATAVAEQLDRALQSRVVVEQAKGILAQEAGVEVAVAFDCLRTCARRRRVKLRALAEQVVARSVAATDVWTCCR